MAFGLLAIGEAMAELRQSGNDDFSVGFAGDTFNTAVYCARALLGSGQKTDPVCYVTGVGQDPLSDAFLNLAQTEHINTEHINRNTEHNLGVYSVSTDSAGERSFHYWRENSAARQLFTNESAAITLPSARIVYLSGISLAIMQPNARRRLVDYLRALSDSQQALVAFDSNYRPQLWESSAAAREIMAEMWEVADIALPSIDDEMNLFGDNSEEAVIERFGSVKRQATAIKRGSRGPVAPAIALHNHPHFEPAAKVIDTTAAGDSFNGGYFAAYLTGASEADCLLAGHQCAAMVVGVRGAIAPSEA